MQDPRHLGRRQGRHRDRRVQEDKSLNAGLSPPGHWANGPPSFKSDPTISFHELGLLTAQGATRSAKSPGGPDGDGTSLLAWALLVVAGRPAWY